MAWVTIYVGKSKWRYELAPVTIVGRHSRCDVFLALQKVPLYWLEIRWVGSRWAWRNLGDGTNTAGSGKELGRGWRTLETGGRVLRGSSVKLHVDPDGPPTLMLWDMLKRHWVAEQGRMEILREALAEAGHVSDADPLVNAEDGDIVMWRGRPFRVQLPPVDAAPIHDEEEEEPEPLSVEIDATNLRAVFSSGQQEYVVKGECVRVLSAYADARLSALDEEGGWVTLREVFETWVDMGGNPDSPERRMSWEKGKLRKQLTRQEAPDVQSI